MFHDFLKYLALFVIAATETTIYKCQNPMIYAYMMTMYRHRHVLWLSYPMMCIVKNTEELLVSVSVETLFTEEDNKILKLT